MARPVRIQWEAPISLADALKRKGKDDWGLYQIYGQHPVFGPNSLLYVGETKDQSFGGRMGQHKAWLKWEGDIEIRLGKLAKGDYTDANWSETLQAVEALTIFWHAPPYNSRNIARHCTKGYHVQNLGQRGRLLPEYSSDWEVPRPDDGAEKQAKP